MSDGINDYIVRDSSIWQDSSSVAAIGNRDTAIRIGVVKEAIYTETNKRINVQYVVEVYDKGNAIPVQCAVTTRFGGIYNYEEYSLRKFDQGLDEAGRANYAIRSGDIVIVAYLGGRSHEGVILGQLHHPGRHSVIPKEEGIAYKSEFNGIETKINKDGEYKRTFKGIQTNIAILDRAPDGSEIPAPAYNLDIGGSYYEFDKTGSWHINDAAKEKPQFIKIDKAKGFIVLTSGAVVIKMEKGPEKVTVTCKLMNVAAADKITMTTKDFSVVAASTAKIKSPKIAIGTDGIELLDKLTKLIDAIGTLQAISPFGPCIPLQVSATWSQVMEIRTAIDNIKGTL